MKQSCKIDEVRKVVLGTLFSWNNTSPEQWNNICAYANHQLKATVHHGLLYFSIKANGTSCTALLDSGATRTFGDLKFVTEHAFELRKLESPFAVTLADATIITCESYCRMKLKFKQFSHFADVYVIDLKGEHEIILGQDFLVHRNPDIDWKTGTMKLRKRHKAASSDTSSQSSCSIMSEYVDSITSIRADNRVEERSDIVMKSAHHLDEFSSRCLAYVRDGESLDRLSAIYEEYGDAMENDIMSVNEFSTTLKSRDRKRREHHPVSFPADIQCLYRRDDRVLVMDHHRTEMKSAPYYAIEKLKEKYPDVFKALPPKGVPPVRFPGAELSINDGDPEQPPYAKVVRLTQSQLAELKVQLEYYLEREFIRPSSSSYATPVFFVPKPHTDPIKWRMVCDYRALNKLDKRDAYPLPAIDTVLDSLRGAKVYSKMDLTQYFHQIPMHPDSIHKTAITTRYGNFEWLVVPFGLRNAPSIAQRLANVLFWDFLDDFIIVFMDDILIYAKDYEDMEQKLDKLFQRMRETRLIAHPEKCEFFCEKLEYLGLGIYADGVFITDQSKEAISKWEVPNVPNQRNKKQNRRPNVDGKTSIRTFIGMCSFFRKFIPRLTETLEPVSRLLQPEYEIPRDWGEEQDAAFKEVKEKLLSSEVLALFDPKKKAYIYPDASDVGVGGVLMQYDDERNILRPVSYMSSKLNATQLRRSTYEKELWALVKCFQVWKHYLADVEIEVRTDHSPLKYFHTQGKLTDKLVRWLDFLSEFQFTIVHVPRDQNIGADGLSKTPAFYGDSINYATVDNAIAVYQLADIINSSRYDVSYIDRLAAIGLQVASHTRTRSSSQEASPIRSPIIDAIKRSYKDDPFVAQLEERPQAYPHYRLVNDLWYRMDRKFGMRILVPKRAVIERTSRDITSTVGTTVLLRKHLLLEFHESEFLGLHQGVVRTLRMLTRYFYWPGMARDVEYHVRTCDKCQRVKARHTLPLGKYVGWKPSPRGWSEISIDLITDLPRTTKGNSAIHVTMDSRSRRVRIDAVPIEITAEGIGELLFNTVVRDHGLPRRILHDNDVRYVSRLWAALWKKCGTHLTFTPSYHPIANSANERSHQVIEDALRTFVANIEEWDEHIPATEFAMNNQVNADTMFTPFQIDCGQHPLDPVGVMTNETDDIGVLKNWKKSVRVHMQLYLEAQQKRLDRINKNRIYPKFEVGQQVLMSTQFLRFADPALKNKHLKPRWIGPLTVKSISRNNLAVRLDFSRYPDWKIHDVIPVTRIKPYHKEQFGIRGMFEEPLPDVIDDVEYYEVEKIVARKFDRRKRTYRYLIKYLGYDADRNEWQWEDDIRDTCEDLIKEYDLRNPRSESEHSID